jgi:hypothetical protein
MDYFYGKSITDLWVLSNATPVSFLNCISFYPTKNISPFSLF